MSTARPTRRRGARAAAGDSIAQNDPFFCQGGATGCLLVHGLTSSPFEMRFLGERLHAAGHTVCAVRLAGHGTRPEDLEPCGWRDWYQSVTDGLEALGAHCSTVIAVGLSLGSLLVLRLACEQPKEVSAVVLLSPALVLCNPWPARMASLLRLVWPLLPRASGYWPKGESDIADRTARRQHPAYQRLPLRSVAELVGLQREVRSRLPEVRQPALAIQARQDHVLTLDNLAILQRELPNLCGTVILPASYHVVTVDLEKERVVEEIIRFIGQVGESGRAGKRSRPGKGESRGVHETSFFAEG